MQYDSLSAIITALLIFAVNIVLFAIYLPKEKNQLGITYAVFIAISCAIEILSAVLVKHTHLDVIKMLTVVGFAVYVFAAYILFLYSALFIKTKFTQSKTAKAIMFAPCLFVIIAGSILGLTQITEIDGTISVPAGFYACRALIVIFYGVIMLIITAFEWKKTHVKTQRLFYLAFLFLFVIPTVYSIFSLIFAIPADMTWIPFLLGEYLMLVIIINLRITNDPLTKVKNRTAFDNDIINKLVHFDRYKKGIYLVFADCDNFSDINKTLGHNVGNMALQCIANICAETAELAHTAVYRSGGDEFAFIFVNHEEEQIKDFFDTVNFRLARNDYGFKLHLSYGIMKYDESMTVSAFLKETDNMLIKAKMKLNNI